MNKIYAFLLISLLFRSGAFASENVVANQEELQELESWLGADYIKGFVNAVGIANAAKSAATKCEKKPFSRYVPSQKVLQDLDAVSMLRGLQNFLRGSDDRFFWGNYTVRACGGLTLYLPVAYKFPKGRRVPFDDEIIRAYLGLRGDDHMYSFAFMLPLVAHTLDQNTLVQSHNVDGSIYQVVLSVPEGGRGRKLKTFYKK